MLPKPSTNPMDYPIKSRTRTVSPKTARTRNPRIFSIKQRHFTKAAPVYHQRYPPNSLSQLDTNPNQCMDWNSPNLEPKEKKGTRRKEV